MPSPRRYLAWFTAPLLVGMVSVAPASLASPATAAATARPASTTAQAAPPLTATKGYTYWGYYQWNPAASTWNYMKVGANDTKQLPHNGDVYGFRWALVVKKPRLPRAPGNFDRICGRAKPPAGQKRIGFVIDYGTSADAVGTDRTPHPVGLCATVNTSFTVQQALLTVAQVRVASNGLICGIDGYPSHGCGATVQDAKEPPPDSRVALQLPNRSGGGAGHNAPSGKAAAGGTSNGSSIPPLAWVVIAVIVILAAATAVLRRRR